MLSVAEDIVAKCEQDASTFVGCKNKLIGTHVVVELLGGELYTGILKDFTNEFAVTLSYAQKMPPSEESEFILCGGTTEKVLQLRNVIRVSGSIDEKDQFNAFRTDKEISKMNGESKNKEPELLPWSADGELPDDDELISEVEEKGVRRPCQSGWEDGWKAETMFEMNKDKVVGKSTFDESLSQYSNVEVQNCTEEQIKRAEQIAKAIENNVESKRNAMLENDDEERNLDVKTEFAMENHRPTEKPQQFPHPQQLQKPQRMVREGTGPRRVSGSTSMTSGKRWVDKGQPSGERSMEQSTANWRSPNPQTSQHNHQRAHFGNKAHRSSSGYNYNQQQQQQPMPQRVVREGTGLRGLSGSTSMTSGKRWVDKGQHSGMLEMNKDKAVAKSTFDENVSQFSNVEVQNCAEEQIKRAEQTAKKIIASNSESKGLENEDEQRDMGKTTEFKLEKATELKLENHRTSEELQQPPPQQPQQQQNGEQQKEKFKLNPAAAPFVPKSKDLTTTSASVTTNTSPLMSHPIPPFVQLPASLSTQGMSTQNIVFYHQQPQTIVSAQIPSNTASYHQHTQNILPAQIPSNSVSYHQQPQTIVPAQIPSNPVFFQQQQQSVVSAQLPSNPLYAAYPIANPGQSIVFVSPTAPNQAVILQPGVAQHFVPVSAATFPSQNINQHYRTVTPNGVNPQAPLQHPQTNICPPPLHPATQGMIIQSPPPPLLNLTMPNGAVSAPPPSYHPSGRFQQQF